MNLLLSLLVLCMLGFYSATPLHAQTITPTPTSPVQYANEFTAENKPNAVISILKNFIQGFDSILGGFIFFTPDPLSDKIILKDNSELPGITKYRDMFNNIAIPVLAIVIASIAISKIGSENAHELKSFAMRLIVTVSLFIIVPSAFSYSIQLNNLLVNKITTTQQFTGFLDSYLDQANEKIQSGDDSEQYGIPHFDFSLVGGILKSLGEFIVKIFLFALTFLFLLGGLLYIGFQFVIRFASLLFLGVLYPVIIPFVLSERTQHIAQTYLKSWFTFLIMQPAFVLGFAITTDIFTSILNAKGPSIGLLFFYTGFLFFLGGVNLLVGRLFGDVWGMIGTNIQAQVASKSLTQPVQSRIRDFKRGLIGGGGSISYNLGHTAHRHIASMLPSKVKNEDSNGEGGTNNGQKQTKASPGRKNYANGSNSQSSFTPTPHFSQELNKKGFQTEVVNKKQGVVAVSGEGYQYNDPKTGLSALYPTRLEAIQDGIPEDKLEKVTLDNAQFIDLSSFNKHKNPNPHNFNAMQESKKRGKDIQFAYIEAYSHPERIRNFLDMSESRNNALGVRGVIAKRQGTKTSDTIIRLYSKTS